MTINREHLAPCPFCGGQADPHQFTRKRWSVDCSSCGAAMISSSTKRDAIESWNTRAQAQASPDDSSPNAVWLTQAHTICADAGIPSGNIVDRLELLSQWVTDRLHDGSQAAPEVPHLFSREWIRKAAEDEAGHSISAGVPDKAALEAEPVEVVAYRYTSALRIGGKWHYQETFPKWDDRKVMELGQMDELMTVSQHNRIMASVPQHDAELIELLIEIDWTMRNYFPGENPPAHERLMARIKAKLASLSAKP